MIAARHSGLGKSMRAVGISYKRMVSTSISIIGANPPLNRLRLNYTQYSMPPTCQGAKDQSLQVTLCLF
jgi:hypothetical protein